MKVEGGGNHDAVVEDHLRRALLHVLGLELLLSALESSARVLGLHAGIVVTMRAI